MTADIEMLSLPEKSEIDRHLPTGVRVYGYTADDMKTYARAVAEHNVSRALAESDHSLRTEIAGAGWRAQSGDAAPRGRSYLTP